jgi:protein N-terminal methyltransferase
MDNSQWCIGHLTDAALVEYLRRCMNGIRDDGVIVVKENISNSGDDIFDELDSSVTRLVSHFHLSFSTQKLRLYILTT